MAIRECTSNCIRHAGGTKIFADCYILGGASVLTRTNDGRAPETPVQEGGGLSGLRRRVEQASGQMTVETRPRFALAASIPGANLAPELCRQRQIDLILMDVQTENRENGLSAAAQIRREYPQIKIVIVTFLIDAEVLRQAKQLGADSLWYKDGSQERLMDIVRRPSRRSGRRSAANLRRRKCGCCAAWCRACPIPRWRKPWARTRGRSNSMSATC